MNTQHWLLVALAAVLAFWTLGAYNRLVALRNAIGTAFTQVDEALGQRAAALAPMDAMLQPALADQQGRLDAVQAASAQLQSAADALRAHPALASRAARLAETDAALTVALEELLATIEKTPDLNADAALAPHVVALRDRAPQLVFARQLFNDAVAQYNEAARQFPTRVLARLFGFGPAGPL